NLCRRGRPRICVPVRRCAAGPPRPGGQSTRACSSHPGQPQRPGTPKGVTPMFDKADLIHRYTRADAIRDGVLIDVSAVAREAGVRYPVALTRTAWERCVAVPPDVLCQDESGRLWDGLFSAIR